MRVGHNSLPEVYGWKLYTKCKPQCNNIFNVVIFVFQIQFIMVFIHASQLLFIECDYPKAFAWIILLHAVMFYFLFYNFYQHSYKKRVSQDNREKILTIKNDTLQLQHIKYA